MSAKKTGTDPIFRCSAQPAGKWGLSLFLIEADDLHPVRALAGRVPADRLQLAARRVDGIRREGLRLVAGDDHEAPGGIDAEAARLLLGGSAGEVGERARGGIDAEGADRAAGALRGVQEPAVRSEVQVGGPDVVVGVSSRRGTRSAGNELAVGRQGAGRAQLFERPGLAVEGQSRHRRGELVEEVHEAVVGRGDEVTRAGAGLHLRYRRRVRGEPAAIFVEQELEHLVGAEVRHEDEAVAVVGADGVRVARGRDHLHRLADAPVGADRIDAHEVAAIGGAKQVAAGTVEMDVREALGERPGADELQRAGAAVDAVRVGGERLGADPGDEVALVRADAHRHHRLFGLEARAGLQRAVGLQRVHADVAVLGVRDVYVRHRQRRGAGRRQQSRHDCRLQLLANLHCLPLPKERSLPILEVTVMTRLLAALALSLSIALPASAQLIPRRDLSYSMALAMATAALDACKARGYAVSVVVVDRGGDTMVAIRADDAGPHTM